jgi:hypothetical protein
MIKKVLRHFALLIGKILKKHIKNKEGDDFFSDDQKMSFALKRLYSKFGYYKPNHIDIFCDQTFPQFRDEAILYFKRHPINKPVQSNFINCFVRIWNYLLMEKLFYQATILWYKVFEMISDIENSIAYDNNEPARIHKGAIYYYLGQSLIENGDLETGYRMMGNAFAEDIKTYSNNHTNMKLGTPAYKFVHFNYTDDNQHFIYFIRDLMNTLDFYIPEYKKINSQSSINIEKIHEKFLSIHPSEEAVILLNYCLARIHKQKQVKEAKNFEKEDSDNYLAGILDLNLISSLILVIDNSFIAKVKNDRKSWYKEKFGRIAERIWKDIHSEFKGDRIEDLNNTKKMEIGIYSTIVQLLNRKPINDNWVGSKTIDYDVAIVYLLRNHSTHNIDPHLLLPSRSYTLYQSIFNVLFFIIDEYYIKNEGFID